MRGTDASADIEAPRGLISAEKRDEWWKSTVRERERERENNLARYCLNERF